MDSTVADPSQQSGPPGRGGWRRLAAALLAALVVLLAIAWALIPRLPADRIAPGVRAAGVVVGGLTSAQAALAIEIAQWQTQGPVALQVPALDRHLVSSARDLGLAPDGQGAAAAALGIGRRGQVLTRLIQRWQASRGGVDLPVRWRLHRGRCRAALAAIAHQVDRPPANARARWDGARILLSPDQAGITLRLPASLEAVAGWLEAGRQGPVLLVAGRAEPQVSAADLAPVDGVIGTYTTYVSGSRNRRHNVALSARALDGVVIPPGGRFSYNQVVGPRTTEAGYKTAPVIVKGELVTGLGGGACQVSSTLYNTALLANLVITKRVHHSHPVAYLPAGRDATVVYRAIDLVLTNPGPHPVVLQGELRGRRLTVMALGKSGGPPVRIITRRSLVAPGPPIEQQDPALAPGTRVVARKAQVGMRVRVVRVVGEGAQARQEVISRDFYRPQRAIVRVGPLPAAAPPPL